MKKTILKYSFATLIFSFGLILNSCGSNSDKTETVSKTIHEFTNTTIIDGKGETTFTVWGNCEMCKETIEKSLKVKGVESANWDVDKKLINVKFDANKINLDQIQKNISLAGYDNVKYKGDDKAYKKLHACCQYERK
jgi:copper chaperone CopZ